MTQVFHFFPSFTTRPFMRMLRVHGTGSIQITVRFLCSRHYHQYAIDILVQLLIRVSLHRIACPLDCFIHIRVIKRETFNLIIVTGMSRFCKVFISPGLFAFAERKRYSHLTAGFQSLPPKAIGHFYRCERYRRNRISAIMCLRTASQTDSGKCK